MRWARSPPAAVDARGGRVELTSVDADGAIQTGEFRGSVFDLKQRKNGQVVLTLKNGDFKVCGSGKKLAAGKGQAVRTTQRFVKRFGGRVIRKLWDYNHNDHTAASTTATKHTPEQRSPANYI